MLVQQPTPNEITSIMTKRRAQSTFDKHDFFHSGDQHIGSILSLIRDNLVTKPNIVMPEVEEEFRDQIMTVLND